MFKKDQNPEKVGWLERRKAAVNEYVTIRKIRMKEERDYFASEGESDPERLAAQRERDLEFLKSLKKIGVGVIVFLVIYLLMKTILGLW